MIAEFQKQIRRLEHEVNELTAENVILRSALEEIASDIDPKQTWNFLAVKRRMIARAALDKLRGVETMKELDEKGFVFTVDGTAYRCAKWGDSAWLFRWRNHEHQWESVRKLTQMDVWSFTRNLTQEQQDMYFKLEEKALSERMPLQKQEGHDELL